MGLPRGVIICIFLVFYCAGSRAQTDLDDDLKASIEEVWDKLKEMLLKVNLLEQKNSQVARRLEEVHDKVIQNSDKIGKQNEEILQIKLGSLNAGVGNRPQQLNIPIQESKTPSPTATTSFSTTTRPETGEKAPTNLAGMSKERNCPSNIGEDSNCISISEMGCYCIVEVPMALEEAGEYCAQWQMKLVAIETRNEQMKLASVLKQNIESTGPYERHFWTSGTDLKLDGQWKWRSSDLPLFYRNWERLSVPAPEEKRTALILNRDEPFTWFSSEVIDRDAGISFRLFSICEDSAKEQLTANQEALTQFKDCRMRTTTNSSDYCDYLDPMGCYCITTIEKTWSQASRFCQNRGMELVSIETEGEHLLLASFLREKLAAFKGDSYRLSFWTSGLFHERENTWKWTATGQPVTDINSERKLVGSSDQETISLGKKEPFYAIVENRCCGLWIHTKKVSDVPDFFAFFICEKGPKTNTRKPLIP